MQDTNSATQWRRNSSSFLFQLPSSGHKASWLHNLNSLQTSLMAFNYSSQDNNHPHYCHHFISKNAALGILLIHLDVFQLLPTTYGMNFNSLAWYFRPFYDLGLIHHFSNIVFHSPPNLSSWTTHTSLKKKNPFSSLYSFYNTLIWKLWGLW